MTPFDLIQLNAAVAKTMLAFAKHSQPSTEIGPCVRCHNIGTQMCEPTPGHVIGDICRRCALPSDHMLYGHGERGKALAALETIIARLAKENQ